MASSQQSWLVHSDLFLDILEHCDLETLGSIKQASSTTRGLIDNYEHSIAKAMLAACDNAPPGRVISTHSTELEVIPVRESFATIREVQLRQRRIDSLVDPGGFLLVDEPKSMGFPSSASLDKFRAGLKYAIQLTDRLADFAADPSLNNVIFPVDDSTPTEQEESPILPVDDDNTEMDLFTRFNADVQMMKARYPQRMQQLTAMRKIQTDFLQKLPSRDLAWLITLAAGASRGYARWCAQLLESDPSMAHSRVMAFKEVLLRAGSYMLHGFTRGRGTLLAFVKASIWEVAKEVVFFEEGGEGLPCGLHMTIMEELRTRLVAERQEAAAKQGQFFDEDEIQPGDVGLYLNAMIAKEVGWSKWNGYAAAKHFSD